MTTRHPNCACGDDARPASMATLRIERLSDATPRGFGRQPGTKIRLVFEMMRQPGGARAKDICAEYGAERGWWGDCQRLADEHGLEPVKRWEATPGRTYARYELRDRSADNAG